MTQMYVTAYPWDVVDEGVDAVLDLLHAEVGVGGLSLWAAVPAVTELRAREVEPRMFKTRGGVFFHPDPARYQASRLKPIISPSLGRPDPLEKIAQGCRERNLSLRAIVSAARTGRLAARNEEMAARNVFGTPSDESLCLANPDVQAFLCALITDVTTREAVSGLVLCDFHIAWTDSTPCLPGTAAMLGSVERRLLSTCFCESCRQAAMRAGVDADIAARSAGSLVLEAVGTGRNRPEPMSPLFEQHPVLGAYLRWRDTELGQLLHRIREASACDLVLSVDGPGGTGRLDLTPVESLSHTLSALDQVEPPASLGPGTNELRIPVQQMVQAEPPALVRALTRAVELGYAAVDAESFGMMPQRTVEGLRQAVRFAKRTVGE